MLEYDSAARFRRQFEAETFLSMEENQNTSNPLNIYETGKIGRLLFRFAIPCVISMLVNSIYNIVDQIFIGHIAEVGYLCNAATTIVFPMVVIGTALALLIGDGAASYLSINLGKQNFKDAKKGVGNAITCIFTAAALLTAVYFIFLPKLLGLFGMTEPVRPYALDYGSIIAIGIPFMIFYTSLNSIIRADGSPKYAMASMLTGAIFNIAADPIFIFGFGLGIKGAALATILGQFISFLISISYLRKFRSIVLSKRDLIPCRKIFKVLGYGVSSFITQMTIVVVMVFNNNLLRKYGVLSRFGAEIPLAVFGIVMKVNQIFISVIVGIAVGAQPIIGYHYGAGKYEKVIAVFKRVVMINLTIGAIASCCFILFPDKLISIFGNGDALYNEFAVMCFRTYLILVILNSFQISASIFFQSIGKPVKASICSISRQILLLVPAAILLAFFFGIRGMLWSAPVADFMAFLLAMFLFADERAKLKKMEKAVLPR